MRKQIVLLSYVIAACSFDLCYDVCHSETYEVMLVS